jgi:hypothetical protein
VIYVIYDILKRNGGFESIRLIDCYVKYRKKRVQVGLNKSEPTEEFT